MDDIFFGLIASGSNNARGPSGSAPAFTYYSAVFDGTNDYLTRGAELTGISDSKLGLVSFWIKSGADSQDARLFDNGGLYIAFYNTNLYVRGFAPGGVPKLELVSSSITVSDGWKHVLISWDMGTAGRSYVYINGVDATTRNQHDDSVLDLTLGDWGVGAEPAGTRKFNGSLSEFYFTTPASWFDITSSTNRDKFYNSGTSKPVNLGSDGSTPTGTQPIVYLKTQPTAWETNSGSGGNFTENGSITDGGADKP